MSGDDEKMSLKEALDLNKHARPGYFSKTIFRTGFIIIVIIVGVILAQNNWDFDTKKISASCPVESHGECINPFYYCTHDVTVNNSLFEVSYDCPEIRRALTSDDIPLSECKNDLCSKKFLQPGEVVGEEATWLEDNYLFVIFFVILSSFAVNHITFEWRNRD